MQDVTFSFVPDAVALGVYVPSHISIICMLYHCLIPKSEASLLASSPMMPLRSRLTSTLVETILSCASLSMMDLSAELGVESEAALADMILSPTVDVLSCEKTLARDKPWKEGDVP